MEKSKVKRALISVSDKAGVVELARGLSKLGVEIVSTGGTAKMLRGKGIPVKEVSEITKFPEILGGRVKTLHPAVHAGILAKRDEPSHMKTLAKEGIATIDLLVVNLYPFGQVASKKDVKLEEVIENIDIGGVALVRAAAKNHRHVGVVVDPKRYGEVLSEIKETGGLGEQTRKELAIEAFSLTSAYDAAIRRFLEGELERAGASPLPSTFSLSYGKVRDVRYGENPHQRAALYMEAEPWGIASARQLQGDALSFNNVMDLDAAWRLLLEFDEPAAAVVKHTNPCGVACGKNLLDAYRKANACDPVSAYGGVIAVNRKLDGATAKEIARAFTEAMIAPSYDSKALDALKVRKKLRVMELSTGPKSRLQFKSVSGGALVQEEDTLLLQKDSKVVTKRKPSKKEMENLVFAWKVAKHVKSNAIVVAKEKQAIGIGSGQTSRVGAVEIAVRKAGARAAGAVLASDAFFPFPDSVQKAAEAGITAIIQPGGSIRDAESVKAANQRGIAMVFTGLRHFRH